MYSPLKMKSRHTIFIWNQFILVLQSHPIYMSQRQVWLDCFTNQNLPMNCLTFKIFSVVVFVAYFILSRVCFIDFLASFPSHILILFYSNGIWKVVLETSWWYKMLSWRVIVIFTFSSQMQFFRFDSIYSFHATAEKEKA